VTGALHRAFIGLGSNQGDRAAFITGAVGRLAFSPGVRLAGLSRIYRTSPVGPLGVAPGGGQVEGGEFLNAVARVETAIPPQELLARLLAIESQMGRMRKGAERDEEGAVTLRPIDLDLLLYGEQIVSLPAEPGRPALTLPHPRLAERLFVLRPLADLAPGLTVPGTGKTVSALAAEAALRHMGQSVELSLSRLP
jgi:2-amino-4-hydroxy-6-hydroxymethyldihydropteridine diphosphokinase